MDWKTIGKELADIGLPLLGAALPFPGGEALGSALAAAIGQPGAAPEVVLNALKQNASALSAAKTFESAQQVNILKLQIDAEIAARNAESADIAVVNTTMQEEDKASASEAWYQKAWRPANGFSVALGSFASVIAVCYLFYRAIVDKDVTALSVIPSLATAIATILAVPGAAVGIAAWHRGKMQIAQVTGASSLPANR
jgi:roadblock/LC7 domain-containing protein